jgi:hypothetical protein
VVFEPHRYLDAEIASLQSVEELANRLGVSLEELNCIASNATSYYSPCWRKGRLIEKSTGDLKKVQKKLKRLLTPDKIPPFVHGLKGTSIISNAHNHQKYPFQGTHLSYDFKKFFRSTSYKKVFKFLTRPIPHPVTEWDYPEEYGLGLPSDIADIIVRLTTYQGHIPTGAPTSPIVAYLAIFEFLFELHDVLGYGLARMTIYVDNLGITFWGEYSSAGELVWVLTQKYRIRLNSSKTRAYIKNEPYESTGVIIHSPYHRTIPYRIHKRWYDLKEKRKALPKPSLERQKIQDQMDSIRKHQEWVESDSQSRKRRKMRRRRRKAKKAENQG